MVGDEAQLYQTLSPRLEQIVRAEVRTSREVVEDACHHAWAQLINHSERVERDKALTWLARTAVRQAWKLNRRERRELSLDAAADEVGELRVLSPAPGPPEQLDIREQLASIDQLPERQRRLLWLQAAGLTYVEMAAYTGDSERTVERQISRATQRLRQLNADRDRAPLELDPALAVRGPQPPRRSAREERGLER